MLWFKRLALALAAAAVVWAGFALYAHGLAVGRGEITATWAASQVATEQAVRQLEHTWQNRVETARIQADAKEQEIKATSGRVAANTNRMHAAALDAARRACKTTATAEWTRGPSDMLADVLNRVGERTSALAAYADRERVAREECQNAWPK